MSGSYYLLDKDALFRKLSTDPNGLTQIESEKRLEEYGKNELAKPKRFSAVKIFVNQFLSLLVVVLIIAGAISYFFGDMLDALAIFVIVILNAILGFVQEFKAEKALEALKKMTSLKTVVIRDGKILEIDSKLIVPGDIVVLETGNKVPADLRLIESVNLEIDESILTGESLPSKKFSEKMLKNAIISDQENMAFKNTVITRGHGKGIVVNTGMQTEFGKLAGLIREMEFEDTPLKKKLEVLAKQLVLITGGIVFLIFIVGLLRNLEFFEMLMTVIALGVAAIPEGLPAVTTITLALGIQQMAKRKALIRKMPAVEALGSATVICSDKTGTLTKNEMTVKKIFVNNEIVDVSGDGYNIDGDFFVLGNKLNEFPNSFKKIIEIGLKCNNAIFDSEESNIIGDPTEGCLLVVAKKAGIEKYSNEISEISFDSKRKMMTKIYDGGESFTKGAPEVLIEKCDKILIDGEIKNLDRENKVKILEMEKNLAKGAYRVLGFAYNTDVDQDNAEENMIFVGLMGLQDPPREEVKTAIKLCQTAGIKVKIVTGDNEITASAIAKQIGINTSKSITGIELDGLSEEEFKQKVLETNIFARVNPQHKYKIVTILKKEGEIVAVTGDGINDAPALKKADIGIAMGIKGTDASKEAAEMILEDDNFATIVSAIEEGRRIYTNIKSFIKFLISANVGEILAIGAGILIGFPLPLLPLQILWMNLATDALPALALGTEKKEKDIMKKPPRNPKENIMKPMFHFILIAGILGCLITLIAFLYGLQYDQLNGLNIFNDNTPSKARTMAFTALILFELALVFSCRGDSKNIFDEDIFSNKLLTLAVLISIILQIAIIYVPVLQVFFKTVPLELFDWLILLVLAMTSISVPFLERIIKKK